MSLVVVPNYVSELAEKRAKELKEQWPDMDIAHECLVQTIISHILNGGQASDVTIRPPEPRQNNG